MDVTTGPEETAEAAAPDQTSAPPVRPRSGRFSRLVGWTSRKAAEQPLSALALGRLAALAVVVRILYIVHQIPGYVPNSDARNYYFLAKYFSEGKGYSDTFPLLALHHTAFRPPAFPVLLGLVFSVTGPSIGVAQAVNVTIGTLVVVLGAVLAARLRGPPGRPGHGSRPGLLPAPARQRRHRAHRALVPALPGGDGPRPLRRRPRSGR